MMLEEEHGEPLSTAEDGLLKSGLDEETKRHKRRELFLAVLSGQFLAFVIAVSAVLTKVLYDYHNVSSPALQNTIGYGLTFLLFLYPCGFPQELLRQDRRTVLALFFVAIADSQAAFFDNLAYSFGVSIASVGMLSSFTIPCVMVLSYCFLKVRYRSKHFIGVAVALIGLVCVVAADILGVTSENPPESVGNSTTGTNSTSSADSSDPLVGDLLILVGCVFYAVSNVSTEAFVKTGSLVQYLVWLGLFSSLISLIQWAVLEGPQALAVAKDVDLVPLLFVMYAITFAFLYWGCGKFLARFDAVVMNLSFLTTDVWGVIFGHFIFSEDMHLLKFVGFAAIVAGVVLYNMESPIRPNTPNGGASEATVSGIGDVEDDEQQRGHLHTRVMDDEEESINEMQVMESTTRQTNAYKGLGDGRTCSNHIDVS